MNILKLMTYDKHTCNIGLGKGVSWKLKSQVEQDLIICRAICALYNDEYLSEHLAFRGGTTLNKIYLYPQPRYSYHK